MNLLERYKDIRSREIYIYGEQEQVEAFLNTYSSLLRIKLVLTDYKNQVMLQPYESWGIETVLFDDVELAEGLLVICSKENFHVIQKRLEYVGKKEYQDYLSCELIEHLLFKKKLMLCMGTQMIEQVCLLLRSSNQILDEYSIIYYAESELLEPYSQRLQEYIHVGKLCDVYVRSSCEKENFGIKILEQNQLPIGCRIISVADYGFSGYFPQIERSRNKMSRYLMREHERLEMSYETLAFSRTDLEIEALCKNNVDVAEIVERLCELTYFSDEKVKRHFAEEIQRFKALEIEDDIKLGDFIEQNIAKNLCRNLNEWNEPIISYVTEAVISKLGLPGLTISKEQRERLIEENAASEIPIYPCVQKALELQDELKDKQYKAVTYYNVKYMKLEEYLYYIATHTYRAMKIMRFTGMDKTLV